LERKRRMGGSKRILLLESEIQIKRKIKTMGFNYIRISLFDKIKIAREFILILNELLDYKHIKHNT
jgi:hypothetical protein